MCPREGVGILLNLPCLVLFSRGEDDYEVIGELVNEGNLDDVVNILDGLLELSVVPIVLEDNDGVILLVDRNQGDLEPLDY